jgi:hypothetical protein
MDVVKEVAKANHFTEQHHHEAFIHEATYPLTIPDHVEGYLLKVAGRKLNDYFLNNYLRDVAAEVGMEGLAGNLEWKMPEPPFEQCCYKCDKYTPNELWNGMCFDCAREELGEKLFRDLV